jgi:hypothetical protein
MHALTFVSLKLTKSVLDNRISFATLWGSNQVKGKSMSRKKTKQTSLIEQAEKLGDTIPNLYAQFRNVVLQDALKGKIDVDSDDRAFVLYVGSEFHPVTRDMSYVERGEALRKLTAERGKVRKLSKADRTKALLAYNKLYAKAIRA